MAALDAAVEEPRQVGLAPGATAPHLDDDGGGHEDRDAAGDQDVGEYAHGLVAAFEGDQRACVERHRAELAGYWLRNRRAHSNSSGDGGPNSASISSSRAMNSSCPWSRATRFARAPDTYALNDDAV